MKISKEAQDYVKDLFSGENMGLDGTDLGNLKSELLDKMGEDYIRKYDLAINYVVREALYGKQECEMGARN